DDGFTLCAACCDSAGDADFCADDDATCAGCVDAGGTIGETCNGADDDCDGAVDDGFSLGVPCDGPDADLCAEGTFACDGSGGSACNDTTADAIETCNGIDDDCDGVVDEGLVTVRSGTCAIASGSSWASCAITPALGDMSRSFLVFGAASDNDTPNSSNVRCRLASAASIVCERNGTTGAIGIGWQTAEFCAGIAVQHLEPGCGGSVTNVGITPVADTAATFLLTSAERDGVIQSNDDFRTTRLTSVSNVEIQFASGGCGADQTALQVVQWSGASVTRGLAGPVPAGTTAYAVPSLAPVDESRTILLYSYRSNAGGTDMCERMLRGEISGPTSIAFSRGNGAAGCASEAIDAVAWERVEFPVGTFVQEVAATMAAGEYLASVAIAPVDPLRTIVLSGGQWTSGQSIGEGSYGANDVIGAMIGVHALTAATTLSVVRGSSAGTARFTSYVVEF
ncbi:MAG: putative metal-binding motif-containing protein, partial [Myxococcota bacterium]